MPSIELKKLKVTYYNDNIVTVALDELDATFIDGEIVTEEVGKPKKSSKK